MVKKETLAELRAVKQLRTSFISKGAAVDAMRCASQEKKLLAALRFILGRLDHGPYASHEDVCLRNTQAWKAALDAIRENKQ